VALQVGSATAPAAASAPAVAAASINAPLAGNIFKLLVKPGQIVAEGDVVVIMEAMKMETEVRAQTGGTVVSVDISEGDAVTAGQAIISLGA
jgi:oxaloacetate decarboxylase alpha subunit